jgi:O-Antigen ligase
VAAARVMNRTLQPLMHRLLQPRSAAFRSGCLLVVVGSGFVVSPEPLWAFVFYLLVMPNQLQALARGMADRSLVRDIPPVLMVAIGLICWFVLTLAWDRTAAGHPSVQLLWVWNGLSTLTFVTGCYAAFVGSASSRDFDPASSRDFDPASSRDFDPASSRDVSPASSRDQLITVLIAGSVVNAFIAFLRLPFLAKVWEALPLRMPGWAETRQPILGAVIIGVGVLLAVSRLLERRSMRANSFAACVGLLFIGLTGSRGPLLAILGALGLMLAMVRARLLGIAVLAVLLGLGLVELLAPHLITLVWHAVADRGGSNRLVIWETALDAIQTSPWVGLGPTARLDRPNEGFPHNLFLSTVFYAGLVGLVLLLALLGLVGRIAWRQPHGVDRSMRLALLAYLVASGMTDLSIVIKGPSPLWYIIWLPLILCMGRNRTEGGGGEPRAARLPFADEAAKLT